MKTLVRVAAYGSALCIALSIACLLWWWFGGSHDLVRLTDCFTIVGVAVAGIGFVGWIATLLRKSKVGYWRLWSPSPTDPPERRREDTEVERGSQIPLLVLMFAGALNVGIGWLAYLIGS